MTVFNVAQQNASLDYKIVAGLERLSQVFRILLWEKAKQFGLSPIQIQLLIFIKHHIADKCTISYLAQEFNFTKPTISDAIKVLEQKKMVKKITDPSDTRSYSIQLLANGKKVVAASEDFANPLTAFIAQTGRNSKLILWQNIVTLIKELNNTGIISVQRTCYNCTNFSSKNNIPFCNLLQQKLLLPDIRIDCAEFERA